MSQRPRGGLGGGGSKLKLKKDSEEVLSSFRFGGS
jgi:hypothetical protein